jgi:hypothetical protein
MRVVVSESLVSAKSGRDGTLLGETGPLEKYGRPSSVENSFLSCKRVSHVADSGSEMSSDHSGARNVRLSVIHLGEAR